MEQYKIMFSECADLIFKKINDFNNSHNTLQEKCMIKIINQITNHKYNIHHINKNNIYKLVFSIEDIKLEDKQNINIDNIPMLIKKYINLLYDEYYNLLIDIDNYIHNFWEYIPIYQVLSEQFISKYKNKLDWEFISEYQTLSEQFIDEHKNKVDWDYISKHQNLSEGFISKHKNRVNWDLISEYQTLSEQFISQYENKVSWEYILNNQNLSDEFIEKYRDIFEYILND